MRRSAIVLIAVLCSTPVLAQETRVAWRQVVPAAAHTAGVGGSEWRTDLQVYNPSDRTVNLTLQLVSGAAASGIVELPEALAPGATAVLPDVLGAVFPSAEAGGLVVVARDASGDPTAVAATSRTWTPSADGAGAYGQGIPAVSWVGDGDLAEAERILPGLESSDGFRTNLGVVNLTETTQQTFEVEVIDGDGAAAGTLGLTLGPLEWVQRTDILATLDLSGAGFTAVVRQVDVADLTPGGVPGSGPPSGDFLAWASRVDRTSHDPTFIPAAPEVLSLGRAQARVLPAVASTPGSGGSSWQTEIAAYSTSDETPLVLWMEMIPTGGAGIGTDPPETRWLLMPGGSMVLDDVLAGQFPEHDLGALLVSVQRGAGAPRNLRLTSRTWTPDGAGQGTYGQSIPTVPWRAQTDALAVIGIEASAQARSNLGLVNPSLNVRTALQVEILDATGASRGRRTYSLEPWSHLQANRILDSFGLSGAGYTAVVSLLAEENLELHPSESWEPTFWAYGSRIDEGTNDPTTLVAVPLVAAARPPGQWYDVSARAPWYQCPEADPPTGATVIDTFNGAYHRWGGGEDFRTISEEVDFPDGDWSQVGLQLLLECPANGLCDHWDRTGSLQMVLNPDDPQDQWRRTELLRFITPYRMEMCHYVDLTPMAEELQGRRILESFIDTWVGPGHSDGEGWRVTYRFVFYPGDPAGADDVVTVWERRNVRVGDPDLPLAAQLDPFTLEIPADASRVVAHLITTGHSFNNSENCAEFCPLRQDLWIDGVRRSVLPWRTDCEVNPVSPQQGTWEYDRNGWCPGAVSVGSVVDITDMATPGEDHTLTFDVRRRDGSEYVNTADTDWWPNEWISLKVYVDRE